MPSIVTPSATGFVVSFEVLYHAHFLWKQRTRPALAAEACIVVDRLQLQEVQRGVSKMLLEAPELLLLLLLLRDALPGMSPDYQAPSLSPGVWCTRPHALCPLV